MTASEEEDENIIIPKYLDEEVVKNNTQVAKRLINLLKIAEQAGEAAHGINSAKIQRMHAFLDLLEGNGMGDKDFINAIKEGLTIAKEKGDTRAYNRMLELWHKLVYDFKSDLSKQLAPNTLAMKSYTQQNSYSERGKKSEQDDSKAIKEGDLLGEIEAAIDAKATEESDKGTTGGRTDDF